MFYLGSTNDGTDGLAIVTNMNGRHVSCEFPFLLNNEEYNYCTTKGSSPHAPWCGTKKHYDHYGLWDYCPAAGKLINQSITLLSLKRICIVQLMIYNMWDGHNKMNSRCIHYKNSSTG